MLVTAFSCLLAITRPKTCGSIITRTIQIHCVTMYLYENVWFNNYKDYTNTLCNNVFVWFLVIVVPHVFGLTMASKQRKPVTNIRRYSCLWLYVFCIVFKMQNFWMLNTIVYIVIDEQSSWLTFLILQSNHHSYDIFVTRRKPPNWTNSPTNQPTKHPLIH